MLIMNQQKYIQKLKNLSFFDKNTIAQFIELSDNSLYSNIKRWLKKGILLQLKKGLYVTREYYLLLENKEAYLEFLANKLREPSYLSLEYVLQKYNILSESVYAFTSVTLKSRRSYSNTFGTYLYRNIREGLFQGFTIKTYGNFEIKEASKAKALFDYLYFKTYKSTSISVKLIQSYRLNLEEFTPDDLKEFSWYCKATGVRKFRDLPTLLHL